MELTNLSEAEKKMLRDLKALEGQSMTERELEARLDAICGTCKDLEGWSHSDEDYNDYDEDPEEGFMMIHSDEFIECDEPFTLNDGSTTHINGSNAWELFFTNHDSLDSIGPDDNVTVEEVDITIPEYLYL